MKILDAIESKRLRRTSHVPRLEPIFDAVPPKAEYGESQWTWRYGATVFIVMNGPEEARDELYKQARRIIAREVFGEVESAILDCMEEARCEAYRAHGDPLMVKLQAALDKCRDTA